MKSYEVRVWSIRPNRSGNPELRWRVGPRRHSKTFATKALADSFRSQLVTAARAGEAFDVESGLPVSLHNGRKAGPTWFEHAERFAAMKWPRVAPNSRRSIAEALTTVTVALVRPARSAPDDADLRRALMRWAFNVPRRDADKPREIAEALAWLRRASLPLSALDDVDVVHRALEALSQTTTGGPAAATTFRRKRAVFNNALRYAVERKLLPANPLAHVHWTAVDVADAVDRRVVANPDQVAELLAAVRAQGPRGQHLVAFFGCLYYAGMRPGEAIGLRKAACVLPDDGWGRLDLDGSEPRSGALWTDSGRSHERRTLKRRGRKTMRPVPIPPELVRLLRAHLDTFGAAPDGRLFRAVRGGQLQESEYGDVWRTARKAALSAEQAASPLAGRPYDLRHAAASLWLNAGVPATEVAQRLGHSVDVLLKVYANCIDGEEQRANERIGRALDRASANTDTSNRE